ncbi:alpha/beta hydrolase [Aestuariicella sp. G3-2]|uniref:alpha/beta fold hydrolase n=1 Tax=Pseudomaricurvus albidus TaxID=2842452 RepID=UPI001C0D4828|nr:alpha/beta hydrolase [Aestuariicella albida]MBU3069416.1 alpha/beta hydrolase [Aestuariicella albida]
MADDNKENAPAKRAPDIAGRVASFDGVEIFYQWWEGKQSLRPVVLCHGFVADANGNWVMPGIVAGLVAQGHSVLAMDARGHGQSDKPHEPECYGESKMAQDLKVLLDELQIAEIDLVGYSMGAVVSLIFASQYPCVRRLVIGGVGYAVVELGGVDTRALSNGLLVEALLEDDPSKITDKDAAGFRAFADALKADRKALAAQAQSMNNQAIALGNIDCPTLLLAGDKDHLAQRPDVLQKAIARSELSVIDGDHLSILGHPEFQSELLSFLES